MHYISDKQLDKYRRRSFKKGFTKGKGSINLPAVCDPNTTKYDKRSKRCISMSSNIAFKKGLNTCKTQCEDDTERLRSIMKKKYRSVNFAAICDPNSTEYDKRTRRCVSKVDITSDNTDVFDDGFQRGKRSVDLAAVCDPNTTEYDEDMKRCVSTVDITSDNEDVFDDGFQNGRAQFIAALVLIVVVSSIVIAVTRRKTPKDTSNIK